MPIARYSAVIKRRSDGMIMIVFSVHPTREEAETYCKSANEWYGEDHPLTPLTIDDSVLFNPKPFPTMKG